MEKWMLEYWNIGDKIKLTYITQVSHPKIAEKPLEPQAKRNFLR
jgi:hypothetical protein